MVFNISGGPISSTGSPDVDGWDIIFYERPSDPGILMDLITIEISVDGSSSWVPIFRYGGGLYGNSSIAGYGEADNTQIFLVDLLGGAVKSGIGIDVDSVAPAGTYNYIRIISPPDSDGGCEADAIQIIP